MNVHVFVLDVSIGPRAGLETQLWPMWG